jgi:hypothetical protein
MSIDVFEWVLSYELSSDMLRSYYARYILRVHISGQMPVISGSHSPFPTLNLATTFRASKAPELQIAPVPFQHPS